MYQYGVRDQGLGGHTPLAQTPVNGLSRHPKCLRNTPYSTIQLTHNDQRRNDRLSGECRLAIEIRTTPRPALHSEVALNGLDLRIGFSRKRVPNKRLYAPIPMPTLMIGTILNYASILPGMKSKRGTVSGAYNPRSSSGVAVQG